MIHTICIPCQEGRCGSCEGHPCVCPHEELLTPVDKVPPKSKRSLMPIERMMAK